MSWKNPDSYGFAAVIAIAIHLAVVGLFLIEWPDSKPYTVEPVPQHMIANMVQEENKAVKERKRKAELEKKRQQREAKRRAEKERRHKLEAQRKKEKVRQEKLKQERLKKQKLAQQKAAEQKRQAEAKRIAEQQRLAAQKAAQEKAAEEERQRIQQEREEQQMLEQLAQEQAEAELKARREAEARAERAAALQSEYTLLIHDQVQSQWRYPPAVDASLEVELRLTLVPTGEVVQVQIIKSSGNTALDRSVEQAIHKASPLPVPKDIAVFEQNFRNFTMKFRPENATW